MAKQSPRGAKLSRREQPRFFDGSIETLSRLLLLLMAVLVVYGSKLLFERVDQPLSKIMIGGDFNYIQQQDLVALVEAEIDGGFLTVDLERLHQVLQDHPWVDEVSIRRQWPSVLKVEVLEEVPIARWGQQGFLNRMGEQLSIADNSRLAALPVLRAQYGSSIEMMQHYRLLAELLLPTGLRLTELQRDERGAWRIETAAGIRLILGPDQMGEKIRRLVLVWESGLNQQLSSIESIDLRYPNGLAIAWRNGALGGAYNEVVIDALMAVQG